MNIRIIRYAYARRLGFTSKEANRMRSWSAEHIESNVTLTARKITKKSRSKRTERESKLLSQLKQEKRLEVQFPERNVGIQTRVVRERKWSEWSRKKGRDFPPALHTQIQRYNQKHHRFPDSKFGYRYFYYRMVDGLDDEEAYELADNYKG